MKTIPSKIMNLRHCLPSLALSALCLLPLAARAQIYDVDGGTTVNVTTTVNNSTANVYVGTNSPNNTLNITGGGQLTNCTHLGISENGTNNNNAVLVTGTGSKYQGTASVRVGDSGSYNLMTVSSGGTVVNGNIFIGGNGGPLLGGIFPSSSNRVVITDSGSAWNSFGTLGLGNTANSANNSLTIANGGVLTNTGQCNIGATLTASNNSAVVTDSGSKWLGSGDIWLQGGNCSLTVSNGGVVKCAQLVNGQTVGGPDSVLVTGTGSVMTNTSITFAAANCVSNTLTISAGGKVFTGAAGYIGNAVTASNNTVLVTDSGSLWQVGASLYIPSAAGKYDQLIVSNGAQVLVSGNVSIAQNPAGGGNNSALVTSTGSLMTNNQFLNVGNANPFNLLTISAGGAVVTSCLDIGANAGPAASNNTAIVTGAGSVCSNANLYVGSGNANCLLVVSNGGKIYTSGSNGFKDTISYVGYLNINAINNTMIVSDSGSAWYCNSTNTTSFYVGSTAGANNNQLIIANGGLVSANQRAIIGEGNAMSNTVLVTGSGSVLSDTTNLFVGAGGNFGGLTVTNGGNVYDGIGVIGNTGSNNFALVTGAGSVWQNNAGFWVANIGSSNQVTVADGGVVSMASGNCYIGAGAGSAYNSATVTGAGSTLTLGGSPLTIGNAAASTNNVLSLGNGGLLTNATTVTLGGVSSVFNLGDGTAAATAAMNSINLSVADAQLNINNGVYRATASGGISGAGSINIASGGAVVDSQSNSVTIASSASGAGGLTKLGTGTLTLSGTDSYGGTTTVSNGTLLVDGTLGGAADVKSGTTLGGNGTINGAVTVAAGATIQPGTGGTNLGTLTINNTLDLAGTTRMGITNAPTGSQIAGVSTLTYGGTLTVTNLGSPNVAGDTYQLFSAGSHTGNFSATNLPPLTAGLKWDWTPANGTLTVVAGYATTSTNLSFSVSGGILSLTWPGSHLGWLAQSNSVSLADTNYWFDIAGSQSVTNLNITIDAALTNVFYRLRLP